MTTGTLMRMSSARFTTRVQIATFEAAEVWTNTVDDATAGHFIQGSQGKRVTGSSGYTEAFLVFGSVQDYSAMTAAESFRIWAYITNVADAGVATPALAIRFVDPVDGGKYFQMNIAAASLVNGGQYLRWRQADMAIAGTPSWAAILSVRAFLYGAAGTITATLDDLVIGS